MSKKFLILTVITATIVFCLKCSKFEPPAPPGDELLDGPVEGLTAAQNDQFIAGDIAFNNEILLSRQVLVPFSLPQAAAHAIPVMAKVILSLRL
jgi:hypothetical protein